MVVLAVAAAESAAEMDDTVDACHEMLPLAVLAPLSKPRRISAAKRAIRPSAVSAGQWSSRLLRQLRVKRRRRSGVVYAHYAAFMTKAAGPSRIDMASRAHCGR